MTQAEFSPEGCTGSHGNPTDMLFRSHLFGPDGAHFELLKEKHHTEADIAKAKAWLKRNRNVVNIKIITETRQPTPLS